MLGLDIDYGNDKGGYAILPVSQQMVMNDETIITWSDYRKGDGEATFGLLSQVSPDGRYVISTVKDRAVFVATPGIEFSQLFFPIKGILAVYDTKTGAFAPLPGADDPEYVQSNPSWSPDGKTIVFARTKAYRKAAIANAQSVLLDEKDVPEFTRDKQPFKYDLYRIPFNEGRGGRPEPIEGASQNGKSNFFAKFSPDGKWIVFCKAENYMLLMPDSELYIIPAEGGEARRLRANTRLMNSWHSFSSNGRWLVFSSKANTPYTQLFLTHIDAEGRSTPPVVLERFTGSDRAANIPEFVPLPADSIAKIKEQFLDAYSFLRAGMANERTGNYAGAVRAYERGLAVEPANVELLNSLGFALFQQGKSRDAVAAFEKALAADPKHWKAHNNMALAAIDLGELEVAEAHYRESLAIEPQPAIYNDLGFVLEREGMPEEAAELYRKVTRARPRVDVRARQPGRVPGAARRVRRGGAPIPRRPREDAERPGLHRARFRPVEAGPRGRSHRQPARRDRDRPETHRCLRPARDDPGRAGKLRRCGIQLSSPRPHPAHRRRAPEAGPDPDAPRTHGRGAQGDGDGGGVGPEPGRRRGRKSRRQRRWCMTTGSRWGDLVRTHSVKRAVGFTTTGPSVAHRLHCTVIDIRKFRRADGVIPFDRWMAKLKDERAKARVWSRSTACGSGWPATRDPWERACSSCGCTKDGDIASISGEMARPS